MNIKKLKLKNFKSFTKEQTIDFNDLPVGFYFVAGDNRSEPELGANGAGKSTLLIDSIVFAFYGKTPNNIKAGNVCNWGVAKNCEVSIEFEKFGNNYLLTRGWNPNKLTLSIDNREEETVTQDDVDSLIGMNFVSFLYSTTISQFDVKYPKFFDLLPSDKLKVFSDILGLDAWIDYSNKAKNKAADVEEDIINLENKISRIKGKIEGLEFNDYTKDFDGWENKQKNRIVVLEQDVEDKEMRIRAIETSLSSYDDNIDEIVEERKSIAEIEIKNINKLESLSKSRTSINQEITKLNTWIKSLTAEKKKFENIDGACPYCKRKMAQKDIDEQLNEIIESIQEVSKQRDSELQRDSINKVKIVKLQAKMKSKQNELDELQGEKHKVERNKLNDLNTIQSNKDKIDFTRQAIEKISKEDNPFKVLIAQQKKDIKKLKEQKKTKKSELKELQRKEGLYLFWIKKFKDVRLFIIESVLRELEISINNLFYMLGLSEWQVLLRVDSKTKSNTTRRGFNVQIKSPFCDDLVPFDCWSGGESQRLRLAGTLGLADVIRSRANGGFNIMVWDEPTQWLSEPGIEDLLLSLKEYQNNNNLSLFMIDQRNFEDRGCFNNVLKVIKDDSGSFVDIN